MLDYLKDLVEIAFPNNCAVCRKTLFKHEGLICNPCLEALPQTHYEKVLDNPVAQLFWGRCKIEHATSMYYINKHNSVHDLIHSIKYRDRTGLGEELGQQLGFSIKRKDSLFQHIDFIIPVPLHWKKEKKRGYNQSLYIAKGIANATGWKIDQTSLERVQENISQTQKTKYERWENVEDIFKIKAAENLSNKSVLLVDDVITTGSTLEACIHVLQKAENIKISIATLATAGR